MRIDLKNKKEKTGPYAVCWKFGFHVIAKTKKIII